MTPKEKAKQVYDKAYVFTDFDGLEKDCALWVVDIVINEWTMATNGLIPSDDQFSFDQLKYWKDVRKEIESF